MSKNPFFNALSALIYVALVSSLMFYGQSLMPAEDNILMPISMLSLLVLSAAVMAYIFFYQPFRLYFDGQKDVAAKLLIQTIGTFALITILAFLGIFFLG